VLRDAWNWDGWDSGAGRGSPGDYLVEAQKGLGALSRYQ
jgi:hypothetical protein